jgi:putative FmdB family regulatory protein
MPTYEYRCLSCKHEYELVQRMSDPPRKRCPKCGKKVERLIGAGAGLLFKGSGFYITDYRSPEYQAKAKAESSPAGGKADGTTPAADPAPPPKDSPRDRPKDGPKDGPKEGPKEGPKPSGRGSEGGSEEGRKSSTKKHGKPQEGSR